MDGGLNCGRFAMCIELVADLCALIVKSCHERQIDGGCG